MKLLTNMKSNKNNSKLQIEFIILFMVFPFLAMATEDSFSDDTNDQETANPIDNYLLLAMLIGIYIAYRFLKSKFQVKARD